MPETRRTHLRIGLAIVIIVLSLGYLPERALLHRLTDLRKSGKLPRTRELTKTCPRIAGQCLRR